MLPGGRGPCDQRSPPSPSSVVGAKLKRYEYSMDEYEWRSHSSLLVCLILLYFPPTQLRGPVCLLCYTAVLLIILLGSAFGCPTCRGNHLLNKRWRAFVSRVPHALVALRSSTRTTTYNQPTGRTYHTAVLFGCARHEIPGQQIIPNTN